MNRKWVQALVLVASLLVGLGGWGSERFEAHAEHPISHMWEHFTVGDVFSVSAVVGSVLIAWCSGMAYTKKTGREDGTGVTTS